MIRYRVVNRLVEDGTNQKFLSEEYRGDYFGKSVSATEALVMDYIRVILKADGCSIEDATIKIVVTRNDEWRSFFDERMAHMYDVMGIKPVRLYDVEWTAKRNADFPERVGQKNSIHAMITRTIM